MGSKEINPIVGVTLGVVVLVVAALLGYKLFLNPQPLPSIKDHPPRPGYTTYPGSGSSGSAAPSSAPAPATH